MPRKDKDLRKSSLLDGNPPRASQEDQENLKTVVDSTAPEQRFQKEQQVKPADQAIDTAVDKSQFTPRRHHSKGSQLKQDIAAEVVLAANKQGVGGYQASQVTDPGSVGLKSMKFSGDAGTILGSAAGTPTMDAPFRGKDRMQRKLDTTAKQINFLASEQVLVEYDQPPALAEDPSSTQGYSGNPKNVAQRMQKVSGISPAEYDYVRSLDMLSRDQIVFASGQQIYQSDVTYGDAPSVSYVPAGTSYGGKTIEKDGVQPFTLTRGNYSPNHITVSFAADGNGAACVTGFTPVSDDWSIKTDADVVNHAATNTIIDMNKSEMDRQAIDQKAGNETEPGWSPLGRVVQQPTPTVGYLRDKEIEVGSEVWMAYRFANKSLAFMLNKTAKDGQRTTGPAAEFLHGNVVGSTSSDDFEPGGKYSNLFDTSLMAKGSASTMIAAFDSTNKYVNKADVLLQPKSLKMHLQTADNNMNVFRLKPEFAAAVNAVDVFSTIDREYDPTMPVCFTDRMRIVHPYKWEDEFSFTRAVSGTGANTTIGPKVFQSQLFGYSYMVYNTRFIIKVTNPLLAGVAYFFEQNASRFMQALLGKRKLDAGDRATLNIPINHATSSASLWDFVVLASVPFIQWERTNSLKDVLDLEESWQYPFSQLISIADCNPMNAVNYSMTTYQEPLKSKVMLPSTAVTWVMPELLYDLGQGTQSNKRLKLLPWYFSEEQFDITSSGFTLKQLSGGMVYPIVRSGVRLAYLDDLYAMEPRELRLCLDRMVTIPCAKVSTTAMTGYVYKYSQNVEGIPALDYAATDLTVKAYCSTPRELGWFFVAPQGVCGSVSTSLTSDTSSGNPFSDATEIGSNTSYKAYRWFNNFVKTTATAILQPSAVAVSRAQQFSQKWEMRGAQTYSAFTSGPSDFGGMALGRRGSVAETFIPFTTGIVGDNGAQSVATNSKLSLSASHRKLYTILQKLPFIINPFDILGSSTMDDATVDPFDYAYLFNLAGFMDTNYDEDIYNRSMQRMNQGWLYVRDPFVDDSPVFRDARKYTQV